MSVVAARSNAGKAAVAAGGVLVAGYGAYYMSNASQVRHLLLQDKHMRDNMSLAATAVC